MLRSIRRQVNAHAAPVRAAIALALLGAFAVPAAVQAQEAAAETHTVRSGDTLWDLAARYLRDPFLWPEIYRLNTSVVEDPHWIYPGEVLVLVARGPVAAVPATDTPAPDSAGSLAAASDTIPSGAGEPGRYDDASDFTLAISRSRAPVDSLRLRTDEPVQVNAVVAGDYRTAAFLDEGRLESTGEVLGPVLPRQIGAGGSTRQTMLLGADVVVTPPSGGTYQVGDSLAAYTVDRKRIHPYGEIVLPTGILVVRSQASADRYVAQVVKSFAEIHAGHALLPLEPFTPVDAASIQAEPGLTAVIVGWPRFQRLKGLGDQLFIDRGADDGVQVGDLFELRRPVDDERGVLVPITVGRARVVHVGPRSATLKVVHVTGPDIPKGAEAVQIARVR